MAPGLPEDEAVSLLTGYREWGIRHLPSHLRSSLLPLYSHLARAGWDVHAGGGGGLRTPTPVAEMESQEPITVSNL